ncbi:MAG: putative phage tail sheath protein [Bacteroidetes bacterium]|nr:putative phage tail sheath protein [Bacteroidota bacterium]
MSTTTTGFIGPARYGPIDLEPDIITSVGEFELVYGDRQQLDFNDAGLMHNYLWHAVRAFFEEGGKRLYIARVFRPQSDSDDGCASGSIPSTGGATAIQIKSRFPGDAGNLRVRFTVRLGQNILGGEEDDPVLGAISDRDVVWIADQESPFESPPGGGTFYIAERDDENETWKFNKTTSPTSTLELSSLNPKGNKIRVATLTVSASSPDGSGSVHVWENIAFDAEHKHSGSQDALSVRFAEKPENLALRRTVPIVVTLGDDVEDGLGVLQALLDSSSTLGDELNDEKSTDAERSVEVVLSGGNDGDRPGAAEYEGEAEEDTSTRTGLKAFESIEDISIVAAPGSTFGYENGYVSDATSIVNLLITHAKNMHYRIAVLDSGNDQSIAQVRAMRAKMDSSYAALYYPWIRILDPVTRAEVNLPPSGSVAGIYARNDINRAVYKAPANEVVNIAIGFEQVLNKSQQEVLNPEGINCFRFFEGRGYRLWGARTISSDPEWKYVNLRRYFAYLERSIDKGTQWAVFEPNGDALWANVRRTIEDFLLNEWQSGALLGEKPEKAYFVRCDRSTMTQNDLDNGRLICLIGVAPLRPAEFVIFRIGQWTADRKS